MVDNIERGTTFFRKLRAPPPQIRRNRQDWRAGCKRRVGRSVDAGASESKGKEKKTHFAVKGAENQAFRTDGEVGDVTVGWVECSCHRKIENQLKRGRTHATDTRTLECYPQRGDGNILKCTMANETNDHVCYCREKEI